MQAAEPLIPGEASDANNLSNQATTPLIRQTLVRKLADLLVLPPARLANNERDFIADILIRSLEKVDLGIRREISLRISGFAEMPPQLQRHLIRDDITVAAPLLMNTPRVDETLLLEACQLDEEHRQIIITRDDLSSAVIDQIVQLADPETTHKLLRREDISVSCGAMDILAPRSEHDPTLATILLRRPELRLDHGLTMFWWLNTNQRKVVLTRFSTDRSIIQEAMHPLFVETFTSETPDLFVKLILKLIDRRHRPRGMNGETVTMDIVERTLKLARQNPTEEFCHAVGLLAGVSQQTAEQTLKDFTGEAFAVLCKSIGLSRSAFNALFEGELLSDSTTPTFNEEKIEELVGVFDSIARDYSRTILRYWDWKYSVIREMAKEANAEASLEEPAGGYLGAI